MIWRGERERTEEDRARPGADRPAGRGEGRERGERQAEVDQARLAPESDQPEEDECRQREVDGQEPEIWFSI